MSAHAERPASATDDDHEQTAVGAPPSFEDATVVQRPLIYSLSAEGAPLRRLCFVHGQPQDPMTIGTEGTFVVEGRGVRAVHAFVHFDGHAVFLCSTDVEEPVLRADGSAFSRQWTQLKAPMRLRMGACALTFDVQASGPPATGSPRTEPPAPASAPPPNKSVGPGARTTPRARLAAVAVACAALVVVIAGSWAQRSRGAPVAESHGAPTAVAPESALPAGSVGMSHAPPASSPLGVVVYPAPLRAPAEIATRTEATRERQAVEALRVGNVERAAEIYRVLAVERPDNVAFEHAARILRARVGPPPAR